MSAAQRFTKAELRAELRRRTWIALRDSHPKAYLDEVERHLRASLTRKQREVLAALEAGHTYIALCAARRAGKTTFLAALIVLKLLRAGHNEQVTYVAESLQTGKRLIWREIVRLVETYHLPWMLRDNTGEILTPAGAQFVIRGLNKMKQSNVGRGLKSILFCIDECQDYEHLLKPLLLAVGPSLMDTGGAFIAAGTPGHAPQGTWFDWCHGKEGGFYAFPTWTIRENEKFPRDPELALAAERARMGWTVEHPDYQREHLGLWITDTSQFILEFRSGLAPDGNVITELPAHYSLHWKHVIGMDFGWNDSCAWTVLALDPFSSLRIAMHAEVHAKVDNDTAAEITKRLVERFRTKTVLCDPSGGGINFYEGTFNPRYAKDTGCSIRGARKTGKLERVRTMNTELRKGRLLLYLPPEGDISAAPLAHEIRVLRWKKREKAEVLTSPTMRDDCFDSFGYAFAEIAPRKPKKKTEEDEVREQAIDEKARFEEKVRAGDPAAVEKQQRMKEIEKRKKQTSAWGYQGQR